MYGKLVDGVLQNPPEEIRRSIQAMKDAGFKPVIDSKPGYDVETQDAIFVDYMDTGAYIRAMYEIVEIEPTEEEQMIEQTGKAMEMLSVDLSSLLVNLTDEQMVVHDLGLVTVPDTAIISFPVAVKSPYGSQFNFKTL